MKKFYMISIAFLLLAGYMLIKPFQNQISDTKMDSVIKTIDASLKKENLEAQDALKTKKYYGIKLNDYEDVRLFTAKESMDVEEIMIVKLKNSSQKETVKKAMEDRISKRLKVFEGYGPKQCELLKKKVIAEKKGYLFMIVGKHAAELSEDVKGAIL